MRLTLNDGSVIENVSCGASDGLLWLWPSGPMTMEELFEIANDPSKTAHMVWEYDGGTETFDGYTDLRVLQKDIEGDVSASLKRVVE